MTPEEIAAVLGCYGLTSRSPHRPGGGTANANAIVETDRGTVFVKRRNPKYAAEPFVRFDHCFMEHMAAWGVVTPLALRADAGERWVRLHGHVYEVYPFIVGERHDRGSIAQVAEAGRALAVFHRASRSFEPPPGKEWPRYRDPDGIRARLAEHSDDIAAALAPRDIAYLSEQVALVSDGLAHGAYHALPKLVVHGDYHPGNVLYQPSSSSGADGVCGIFDLDWATFQPRVLDIADGLMLFCGERSSDIDGADIVSLTQTWRPSRSRGTAFLSAYLEIESIEPQEREALPTFVRALWLSCRTDGMAKVAPERRCGYLLDGLLEPLRAMDAMESLW
jgi:Ser/Thr protein kinase RdoA (MazF antagonist)